MPEGFTFDELTAPSQTEGYSLDELHKSEPHEGYSFSELTDYHAPEFDAASAQQPVLTEQEKETAAAPWYKPPPEWSEPLGGRTEIPSGANTPIPALTIPAASMLRAAGGVADYFTSPKGYFEALNAMGPGAVPVFLKWTWDMLKGGKESIEGIGHNLANLMRDSINKGVVSANNLGVPKDADDLATKEHLQDLADNIVNTALMGLGAKGAARGAMRGIVGLPRDIRGAAEGVKQFATEIADPFLNKIEIPKEDTAKIPDVVAQDPDMQFALQSAQEILRKSEPPKVEEVAAKEPETVSEPEAGLIKGTALEKWADEQLKGGGTHLGPDLLAAYIVKGAATIERGITDSAGFSAEVLKEAGEEARPFLDDIFRESQRLHQSKLARGKQAAAALAGQGGNRPPPPISPQQQVGIGSAIRPPSPPISPPPRASAPQAASPAVEISPYDPRARFADVGRLSAPVEKLFTQTIQAGPEARTIINDFVRRSFGRNRANQERLAREFVALGWDNRRLEAQARGVAAPAIPALTPQEAARIRAQPEIQNAIATWNREIAPRITDIRNRNGMLMNPNWGNMDLMLNLPAEYDPAFTRRSGVSTGDVFNEPMRGEGALQPDPIEALNQIVRGHLRYDASEQLANAIRRDVSIPPPPNLAHFPIPPRGQRWRLPFRGRNIEVEAIDLAPDNPQGEYHYVPVPVAEAWKKQMQDRGQWNSMIDRARGMFLSWGILPGSFMPHAVREIAAVSGRIAQSGQTWWSVLPSWMGSNWKTLHRMMHDMRGTPYGTLMQQLVDRTGADRGAGFAPEPTTRLGRAAGFFHEALFNPNWGIDVMARRTLADSALIKHLGVERLRNLERDVNAGTITPLQAMRWIEGRLGNRGMVSVGREVNNTMGYGNTQTRAATLNWVQRLLPFISSESGKIPDEIRRFVTGNISPTSIVGSVRRGEYAQLAKQIAGSLSNGAVGVFALMSAINYLNTKAQTGTGVPITDNPEGRKTDIWLAPDWYWSNLDPGLERAARILGAREALDYGHKPDIKREVLNEALSVLAPDIRWAFTVLSDKSPYFGSDMKLMPARLSDKVPFAPARNVLQAIDKDKPKSPAVVKDVAGATGVQLVGKPTAPEVLEAVRLNNITDKLALDLRKMPKSERRTYFNEQMEKLKIEGSEKQKIKRKLGMKGLWKYDRDEE